MDAYAERILYPGHLHIKDTVPRTHREDTVLRTPAQRGYCTNDSYAEKILLFQGHLHREDTVPWTLTQKRFCTKDTCTEMILYQGHLHREYTTLHPGHLLEADTVPRTLA
jgi:hypothetical protein